MNIYATLLSQMLLLVGLFVLPAVIVFTSRRPVSNKGLWVFATLFTSWLGLLVFLAVTEFANRSEVARDQRA